jgi:hypothetical protein
MRTNSIEYEKRKEGSDEKYRVHYKTVNIVLDECFNELVERNNTAFIVAV